MGVSWSTRSKSVLGDVLAAEVGQFLADGQEYMSKTGLDDYLQTLLQQIVQTRSPDSASQIEVLTRCSCVLA